MEVVAPEVSHLIQQRLEDRIAGKPVPPVYETIFQRKDSTQFQAEIVGTPTEWQEQTRDLIFFRDISDRKKIEQAERNQRTLVEALQDVSRALNSTLNFDEVLDEILNNIGRIVPIDSVNIALIEDQGKLHFTHFIGYQKHKSLKDELKSGGLTLAMSQIFSKVYDTCQPVIISDTQIDDRWIVFPGQNWIRSCAIVPLRIKNDVVGFLNLDSPTPGMYTDEHSQILLAFADQAALAIQNAQLYADVQEFAIKDDLTGVLNRRGLFELGEREIQRTIRFGHPLSAIMFDIDHFKNINDTYGHPIGDRVLRVVAKCCKSIVRNVDIVIRYGGDEFFLLLTETDIEGALSLAERLRNKIEETKFSVNTDENDIENIIHATISLGLTEVHQGSDNLQNLINRADQALYDAKKSGRNQIKTLL